MPCVTKCHCIRSPTDFSDAGFSSFERRDSGFESKMRARFGIESIHGTGWAVWTGKFGSLGVTGLKIPIGDPCIITILTCARIQLLVRIGSLGSCDNNDSCLRNVNNLFNKSPLQRLKWKKKKNVFLEAFTLITRISSARTYNIYGLFCPIHYVSRYIPCLFGTDYVYLLEENIARRIFHRLLWT